MGSVFSSSPEDNPPPGVPNVNQHVLSWEQIRQLQLSGAYDPNQHQHEAETVVSVKNPFAISLETVLVEKDDCGQCKLTFAYASTCVVEVAVFKHAAPAGVKPSECSTPKEVPVDWNVLNVIQLQETPQDSAHPLETRAEIMLPPASGVGNFPPDQTLMIILIEAKPVNLQPPSSRGSSAGSSPASRPAPPASPLAAQWTQWYFLRFEPLSGRWGWYLIDSAERMNCGKQTFSILKIFTNKESPTDEAMCLICQTLQSDTMVLPCRHLCLCNACAENVRMRDPKCPICRGGVQSLLRLSRSQSG